MSEMKNLEEVKLAKNLRYTEPVITKKEELEVEEKDIYIQKRFGRIKSEWKEMSKSIDNLLSKQPKASLHN